MGSLDDSPCAELPWCARSFGTTGDMAGFKANTICIMAAGMRGYSTSPVSLVQHFTLRDESGNRSEMAALDCKCEEMRSRFIV